MLLDDTSEKIDIVLGSSPSTELDFMASYMVDDGSSLTAENNDGTTSGTTDVAVVPTPGSGEQHLIKWLTVYNPSGNSAVNVTLKMDDGTDEQKIVTRSLGPDETLEYSDGQWRIAFSSGGSSYTDEDAQDAVGNNFGTGLNYDDATPDYSLDESVLKDGGVKEIDASEFAGSSGTDGQVLTSTGSAAQWESSSGGSAITYDINNDDSNESTDLTEIATTNEPSSSIASEPTADKALFDWGNITAITGVGNVEEYDSASVSAAQSSVDLTGLDTDYNRFRAHFSGLHTDTHGVHIYLRVNNGTSWQSGSSDYKYYTLRYWAGDTSGVAHSRSSSQIRLTGDNSLGNASGEHMNLTIQMFEPASGDYPQEFRYFGTYVDSFDNWFVTLGGGSYQTSESITGIRLVPSSGNIDDTEAQLFGIG